MTSDNAWKNASHKLLNLLVRWSYTRSRTVIAAATVFFLICILYAAHSLVFIADRTALVDSGEKFARLRREYASEFPNSDELVVLVEGAHQTDREAFVNALADRLAKRPELFRDVLCKVDLKFLKPHALSLLDTATLKQVAASLEESKGMMASLGGGQGDGGMGTMFASSSKDLAKMLPMLNEIIAQFQKALDTRGNYTYESPFQKAFFAGAEKPQGAEAASQDLDKPAYTTLGQGDKQKNLLVVRPTHDLADTIDALRIEVDQTRAYYPGVDAGITGEPVLDTDEMDSSISDSARATLWSLGLISFAFLLSFRYLTRPIMAMYCLLLSMGYTIGFTTLAIGHLNLLTVTFATMLLGLGADFGIHFIYGYEEERYRGLPPYEAMQNTMDGAGAESFTGAITTAIAFYAITFTDFRGIAELGMIAGTGVMLCFATMSTVLPALIFLQEERNGTADAPVKNPRPAWAYLLAVLERRYLARPKWIIFICICITLLAASMLPLVKFDYNLLNLQSRTLQSVQTEMHMLHNDSHDVRGHGILFAVSLADSIDEAKKRVKEFSRLSTVATVESVLPLIPTDYPNKLPYLKKIEEIMAQIPLPSPEGPAEAGTGKGLMKMGDGFMVLQQSFDKAYAELIKSDDPEVRIQAKRFKDLLAKLFDTLQKMGPGPISDSVTAFQKNLFGDLHGMIEFLKAQRAEPQLTLNDLPEQVKLRSVGRTGKILLRIYPKGDAWDREVLGPFVAEIQKIDDNVIGTPVEVYYHTEALKRAYEVSGWYALGAITVVLLLHFRKLRDTLLALMPKLVGVIWLVGTMAYYKIDFNPANFMALPLILGIGLIFGVHVVHRLLQSPHEGVFSHSTGPAIALSATTTMCGFGTLIMAKHQGISSLGFLMTFGVGASLLTSVVLLPCVMRLLKPIPDKGAHRE